MTSSATPASPSPEGTDPQLVTPAALSFEEQLHAFWTRNRSAIIGVIVLVLIALIAKGGWEIWQAQQETKIEKAYAAANTSDKLRSFASAHRGHTLAGIAQLRLADEAYTAGKSAEAIGAYEKAAAVLKDTLPGARAQLGIAMAKLQAGQTAEGQSALQQLANDTKQLKGIRAEALYHLATLAAAQGSSDDVKKYSDQLITVDPASPWTQRAMMLRASQPAKPAASAPAATDAAPQVKLNLPGGK